jgi:Peptidase A4 family
MTRRWSIPFSILVLTFGSMLAGATAASASTTAHTGPPASAHGFIPGGLMQRPTSGPAGRAVHGKYQVESSNWSGYAVTGGKGAFSSVSASWTQPTATCSSGDQYAAFWVGLDGYSSDSVEQTGSDSDCDGRTPDYYGWYEMYPADPVYYSNTVKPGDSMSASVTFSGTDTYTLVLTDHTQDWTQTQKINESGFDRSSAEVITEAPCCTNSGGILPLADFHTINYTSSSDNGSSMGTQDPTSIIMVDTRGRQEDSTSSMTSGGNFSNTWIRSN